VLLSPMSRRLTTLSRGHRPHEPRPITLPSWRKSITGQRKGQSTKQKMANHAVELAQEHHRAAERAKHKAEDVHTASSAQLKALEKGVADAKGLVTEATKRVQMCSNEVLADTTTLSELRLMAHGLKTTAKEVNLEMVVANKVVVAHKNDATKVAYSVKAVPLWFRWRSRRT
jgi:uncharacterized protein (DUF885 family)